MLTALQRAKDYYFQLHRQGNCSSETLSNLSKFIKLIGTESLDSIPNPSDSEADSFLTSLIVPGRPTILKIGHILELTTS